MSTDGVECVIIYQRKDRKTPHELRRESEAERDALKARLAECLGSIDAFLAESMPWTHPTGAAYIDQLGEIASRRLQYTLGNEDKAPATTEGEKP